MRYKNAPTALLKSRLRPCVFILSSFFAGPSYAKNNFCKGQAATPCLRQPWQWIPFADIWWSSGCKDISALCALVRYICAGVYCVDDAPISCVSVCNSCLCGGYARRIRGFFSWQAAEKSWFCFYSVPPRVICPVSITNCCICSRKERAHL